MEEQTNTQAGDGEGIQSASEHTALLARSISALASATSGAVNLVSSTVSGVVEIGKQAFGNSNLGMAAVSGAIKEGETAEERMKAMDTAKAISSDDAVKVKSIASVAKWGIAGCVLIVGTVVQARRLSE